MLYASDIVNILLPVLRHWVLWFIFLAAVIVVLYLYAYPYIKKPERTSPRKNLGIPITAIVSLYIFTKMLEGVIYQGSILKMDTGINQAILALNSNWINTVASFITNFGGVTVITILFVFALAVLLYKKRWRYAIISTIALLGAVILQSGIKALVQRARPENLIETNFSFPSGHALTAIVFVSLLIYSFKDDFKNKIIRYVLISAFTAFFVIVGISRIILNVHWFSDVIAGMSLGLFWFMLLVIIERAIPGVVPAVKKETKEAKPIVSVNPTVPITPIISKK
jgi:membrane-associated phospholipid phosphatase